MWCTAGFFHAAGYTITRDGATPGRETEAESTVFSFDPIRITSTGPGGIEWAADPNATRRLIFHVRDTEQYPSAVIRAMKSLLVTLPQARRAKPCCALATPHGTRPQIIARRYPREPAGGTSRPS